MIDEQGALAHCREGAVTAERHLFQVLIRTDAAEHRIHAFGRILIAAGIASPIRKTRGEDIMAACGQLKSMSELKKGQKVKL